MNVSHSGPLLHEAPRSCLLCCAFFQQEELRRETVKCLQEGGPSKHILNVGHGVPQGTPVENVALFCDIARQSGNLREQGNTHVVPDGLEAERELARLEVGLVGC